MYIEQENCIILKTISKTNLNTSLKQFCKQFCRWVPLLTQIRASGTQAPRFGHLRLLVKLWALIRDINWRYWEEGINHKINAKF
jgi:hypothetical protein